MDKIAVLIPCYNEEKTIAKVVKDAREALPEAVIYVYDNNSRDRTVELAREAGAQIRYEHMQGKGNVIRRMEYAREMADKVLHHNADMVVGDRLSSTYFTENKRPFHNFGNSIVRSSINKLFRCNIKDIMTGYRAFSYGFVKTFPVLSTGFEIETEMTIHAVYNNLQIENVIVDYRDRPEGSESKLNTFSDGFKVIRTIVKLYRDYKPFGFFGSCAAVLALIAVLLFIPILISYLETGLVLRFPTLFCCGFIGLAAVQSFFAGLILSNMALKNRRDFEYRYALVMRNIHRENA